MSKAEEELRALEAQRQELEAALGELAREKGIKDEVEALRLVVDKLETEVEAARSAAEMEKNVEKKTQAERTYEALAARMKELKEQMLELANQVHQDRSPKTEDDASTRVREMATQVKKQAVAVKFEAERNLDSYAKSLQGPGESFEKAYSRALDTEMGQMLMRTLDDAQALSTGGPTAGQLDAHRKSLA
jgi:ribosome-binding ATPase YchF (GTP1/OBG family)